MSTCDQIPANPDVSGIGIRLSVYITIVIISLIPNSEEYKELLGSLRTNAGLNGLALLITAMEQTFKDSITLYHAIIILHMLGFLGFATNPTGAYRHTAARFVVFATSTWLAISAFIAWFIYVWSTAPRFGPSSSVACNHSTKYVVLFFNVRATVPWFRWTAVSGAAVSIIPLVLQPVLMVAIWLSGKRELGRDASSDTASRDVERAHPPQQERKTNFSEGMTQSKSSYIGGIIAAVYAIVMLELTVKRNNVESGESAWTFGQIFAILVTFGSINEVAHFIMARRKGGKKSKSKFIPGDASDDQPKMPQPFTPQPLEMLRISTLAQVPTAHFPGNVAPHV